MRTFVSIRAAMALALAFLGASCGNQTEDSSLAARLARLEQTCGVDGNPAACNLDRAKLDNLVEAHLNSKLNADQRWDFERRCALYTEALTKAAELPALEGTPPELPAVTVTVKRSQEVLSGELQKGVCTLQAKMHHDVLKRAFEFPAGWWPQLAAHARYGFLMLNWDDDEPGSRERAEYNFFAFMEFFPSFSDTLRGALKKAVTSEAALHTLGPWIVQFLPTFLPVDSISRGKARLMLADLWEASDANFDKLAKEAGEYAECYKACKGEDCDKCDELSEVWTLSGIFLRRWIAVRDAAVAAAGQDQDKIKDADNAADDMIVLYRYWLARAGQALGAPDAGKWIKEVERELKGADTLAHRDEYVAALQSQGG